MHATKMYLTLPELRYKEDNVPEPFRDRYKVLAASGIFQSGYGTLWHIYMVFTHKPLHRINY